MNDAIEATVKELKLDRSNWERVKFGDVAIQQKKSVDRENTHLTRYVKGEHMGSEDLHLREWGELADEYLGPAFIRYFEEGDILYGSRRTYLRKVTIAPFEGITSNTTFVIKANEEKIDKRLLPFLMLSEGFSQHSINNSKGSVNPYVNWKDLAGYEFCLPSMQQQTEIAELLWGLNISTESDVLALLKASKLQESYFMNSVFEHSDEADPFFGKRQSKHPVKLLDDLITVMQYGISESLNEKSVGIPVLRMNNLQDGKLELSDLKHFDFTVQELAKYKLNKGDILFNRTNSFDLVGKVSLFDECGDFSFASYLLRIKTKENDLDARFLNAYLNSSVGMSKIRKYRTPGVSQSNINAQNLKRIPVPTPDMGFQENLMNILDEFDQTISNLDKKVASSKALQKSLINQVF